MAAITDLTCGWVWSEEHQDHYMYNWDGSSSPTMYLHPGITLLLVGTWNAIWARRSASCNSPQYCQAKVLNVGFTNSPAAEPSVTQNFSRFDYLAVGGRG